MISVNVTREEGLSPDRAKQLIWLLLALGAAARLTRYLLQFPLWCDEAYLSVNYLDRGYLDLLQPLEYHQVCPLLFLWVQLTLVKLLGFSEYSLRLFSLLCGLASLAVFRRLAGRLFQGTTLVMAVGVFSVAYPGIRYSAEAKPYGSDLLVSLVLLTLAVEWLRAPRNRGWTWALIAVTPVAIGLSYPAVFIAGAISLAAAFRLWRSGSTAGWLLWAAYGIVVAASFTGFCVLAGGTQTAAALEPVRAWWHDGFPPISSPWRLPGWLLAAHTGDMLAHPFGGRNYGSTLTFLLCVVALIALARRRQWTWIVLCLGPLALNFVAAAVHRYPYGGHVRIAMHLAPIVCLLAGLGLGLCVQRIAARRPDRAKPVLVAAALLGILAAGSMVRDVLAPFRSDIDQQVRDFARWFWRSKGFQSEVLCLKTDLGQAFAPRTLAGDDSSMYVCNQRIYSPRHREGRPPDLSRASAERPLCCVRFRSSRAGYDEAAFQAWLRDMQTRYQLVAQESQPFPCRSGQKVHYVHYVETYEFVPKRPDAEERLTAMSLQPALKR